MMVVDASALVEVLLNRPSGERVAHRLLDPLEALHAPHLIDLEVAQALRRYQAAGGVITISRKLPVAGDEYTPAQRRSVDARLTEALKGPYHGPFETAEEVIGFIRKEIRNRKAHTSCFSKSAAFPADESLKAADLQNTQVYAIR
jgi:predicted nucleic acid-binding protein